MSCAACAAGLAVADAAFAEGSDAGLPAPTVAPAPVRPDLLRGGLQGVVTAAPIGVGVPNASVTLRSTTETWSEVRTTDRDGLFRFDDLPAGLYSLEAHAVGLMHGFVSPIIVVPGIPVIENLVLFDPRAPPPKPPPHS